MLKNEEVLLKALYTDPQLFQQAVSLDREAAFAAVHDIVPDCTREDLEKFYDVYAVKYVSLIRIIDAAVRDPQIKEKIFSADKALAYETAQQISTGYSKQDFEQFMEQQADLAFQCMAATFMETGNTPLTELELTEVTGGMTPFQMAMIPGKIIKPLQAKSHPEVKKEVIMGVRSFLPDLIKMVFGAIGHCFVAGSLVATPQGNKPIEKIQVGDEVLGATEDGKIVTCRVTELLPPAEEHILTVRFHDGTVWHTTASQWFYTGTEFYSLLNIQDHTALTVQGTQVAIDEVIRTDRTEIVYDFVVDGYNVMFINGIAAEGYSEA